MMDAKVSKPPFGMFCAHAKSAKSHVFGSTRHSLTWYHLNVLSSTPVLFLETRLMQMYLSRGVKYHAVVGESGRKTSKIRAHRNVNAPRTMKRRRHCASPVCVLPIPYETIPEKMEEN